jgi:hypothetical protein
MKLTRLIVAAVLMAGLGGLVWWSNKKEAAKAAQPPPDTTPKILALKDSDIRQIDIQHRDGEDTVVKRNDANQWQIVGPKTMTTDQSSVGTLASSVANIFSERVVDPNVTDLKTYGLSPAVLTIKIDTSNGKSTTLLVGEDSPSGSVYAKVDGDPRLFTMSKSVKDSLDKTAKDLRDRRLLPFDTNLVSSVDLNITGQPPIEFKRIGPMQWQIVKPRVLRADNSQVEDLTGRLHEAQMDPTVSDEDEKKYAAAFASAPVVANVTVTDPSGTEKMEVRKSKDAYYAKSSVMEGVHKLTAADLTKFFDKKLDDFRAKKLFDFGFNDPSRIEIKDGAKILSVQKTGDNWISNGKTMDTISVEGLIDKLRDMAAAKLIDNGTLGKPEIEMTVVSGDGKTTDKVQIAPSGKDFLAKRDDDPTLYQLDASTVSDLRASAGDVKPQAPAPSAKK